MHTLTSLCEISHTGQHKSKICFVQMAKLLVPQSQQGIWGLAQAFGAVQGERAPTLCCAPWIASALASWPSGFQALQARVQANHGSGLQLSLEGVTGPAKHQCERAFVKEKRGWGGQVVLAQPRLGEVGDVSSLLPC